MIKALANFDPRTAAGILARMALALEGDIDNPDARPMVPDEGASRQQVLDELRARFALGTREDEASIEQLYQALDEESDRLLGLPDLDPALERLSERAELPSDRYVLELYQNLGDRLAAFGLPREQEEQLIRSTVREPHAEQHYGPRVSDDRPSLVSLFARRFEDPYPHRSFILLVLGYREGTVLNVWDALRIYPAVVNVDGAVTLVDMVERFANHFGYSLTVSDRTSKFVLAARLPWNRNRETVVLELRSLQAASATVVLSRRNELQFHAAGRERFYLSMLLKRSADEGVIELAFVMAIDIKEYRSTLRRFGAVGSRRVNRA